MRSALRLALESLRFSSDGTGYAHTSGMSTEIQNHPKSQKLRRIGQRLLLAAALAAPSIGAASVATAQEAWIEIDTAPRHYDEGPHTVYRGEPVYWVDGRWYARHGQRWVYYRDEPRELVRYRTAREVRHDRHVERRYERDERRERERDYREYRRDRERDRRDHVRVLEGPPVRSRVYYDREHY